MGFYIGILIKSSPPKGGGTQDDDFTKGFTKGIFENILRRRNGGVRGTQTPLHKTIAITIRANYKQAIRAF